MDILNHFFLHHDTPYHQGKNITTLSGITILPSHSGQITLTSPPGSSLNLDGKTKLFNLQKKGTLVPRTT